MTFLCDCNIWIALTVGDHSQHEVVKNWFTGLSEQDSACFCRATQISFLRLLTQPIAPGYVPCSNDEALAAFKALTSDDSVSLLDEPAATDSHFLTFSSNTLPAPKRWMDAYLAAFALTGGYRFVSLDKGFKKYESLDFLLL